LAHDRGVGGTGGRDPRTPSARGVARVTPSSGASSGAGSRARGSASVGGAAARPGGKSGSARNVTPKKAGRRRLRRIALIAGVTSLLLVLGGMSFAYVALQVPLPSDNSVKQQSRIYYSDGKSLLAAIGSENRTYVTLDKVPIEMQHAIIAAEDRTFYENNGISVGGIARAFWANVRGQDVQGGSTITQQYVKNAHLTDERTLTRKFREIGWAIKANQKYSKAEILEFYLNTIYFGRGAHGIQAAAETYFGIGASKLTVAQSAVLAGVIKAPSVYDPAAEPAQPRGPRRPAVPEDQEGQVQQQRLTAPGRLERPDRPAGREGAEEPRDRRADRPHRRPQDRHDDRQAGPGGRGRRGRGGLRGSAEGDGEGARRGGARHRPGQGVLRR
jgi:hypothetical protein